jgi:hypothetical protein
MGEVKSAFEKAMEKINEIERLTPEEKEEQRNRDKVKSVLASFYKGELDRDGIWDKLRGTSPSLLREAQQSIAESLRLGNNSEEFQQRKEGIVAIEALMEKQNTASVEHSLNSIGKVQKEYLDQKERAFEELRAAVEENPQLRLRQVRTPDGRVRQTVLPVDEAIHARMTEFLAEHEKRYGLMFDQAILRLKKELK